MSITIATVNVNGIRAATKARNEDNPGMIAWLKETEAEVVAMQEVRATVEQSLEVLAPALADGWHYVGAPAATKGRAGVGILSREPLEDVRIGFGSFLDSGRWLEGSYRGIRVASLYLPSGVTDSPKLDEKYHFLDEFTGLLEEFANEHEYGLVVGDWNICHREQDLKNSKPNRKKSGHLADERAWMDSIFGSFPDENAQVKEGLGEFYGVVDYEPRPIRTATSEPKWFDVARRLHPEDAPYTWWTYRGQAFNNDAGWRIDLQAATRPLLETAQRTWVEKAPSVETRWSDHSPLLVTYGL